MTFEVNKNKAVFHIYGIDARGVNQTWDESFVGDDNGQGFGEALKRFEEINLFEVGTLFLEIFVLGENDVVIFQQTLLERCEEEA